MGAVKNVVGLIDVFFGKLGYRRARRAYQDSRFPEDQYRLISATGVYSGAKSSLEVGCNKGRLVKMFARDGKFSVGLDLADYWAFEDNERAVLGTFPIDRVTCEGLPTFDILLVLSVHHQWVKTDGDASALGTLQGLFSKAGAAMFIEFAAVADKYGYKPGDRFQDNDEASVVAYSKKWLLNAFAEDQIEYLGKTRELEKKEPYRFLFVVKQRMPYSPISVSR